MIDLTHRAWPVNYTLWIPVCSYLPLNSFYDLGDKKLSLPHIITQWKLPSKYCPKFLRLALNIAELRGEVECLETANYYEYVQLRKEGWILYW